ncbi:YciI family protein [Cryptosporangium phraense]|uniref:Transcription initiation protein n=1 Tax=Cryptosporangium phraense TaxID=2593070 RepID=A0A545AME7_9ACTN|nr:YciI family protein [Cryptosporangium phraense]TQS42514.1 transcription initiation protein [Cryptosporangium phraense]
MKYLMLVCVDEHVEEDADPEPWITEMESRGIRQTGNRLQPIADSTTVRVRNGEVLIADGPFAETKEQIGGFDILECRDLDEAIEVAAKHPAATFGTLELRPFWSGA